MSIYENTSLGVDDYNVAFEAMKKASVSVIDTTNKSTSGINRVAIITRISKYDNLRKSMNELGVIGMTVTQVMGCGIQKGACEKYRSAEMDATLLPKVQIDVVVSSIPVSEVIKTAKKVNQNITSFSSAMCRVLSKYVPIEKEGKCPECGSDLIH